MDSNQAIQQVVVEEFYPTRKGLGLLDRLAAIRAGKWSNLRSYMPLLRNGKMSSGI